MTEEQVVLVDERDKTIGLMDKLEAHRGEGTLHRAISVLLFRKKNGKTELLLQQRSKDKPLWPLFWTNTVCTHPRDNESYEDCAVRRLKEEMGIEIEKENLRFVFRLKYQARYNEQHSEHELDSVYVGEWDGKLLPVETEVASWKWVGVDEVKIDTGRNSQFYTPWFRKIMEAQHVI